MGAKSKCRIDEHGRECTKCREYKPWPEYHKGRGPNNKAVQCRTCVGTASLQYYHENKEARTVYRKQYYSENREHLVAVATQWKRDHPDANRKQSRDDYHRNKEARRAKHAEWVKKNPDKVKESDRRKVKRKPELYRALGRASVRRYRENWPDRMAHFEQRRRAAKLRAQPKWADEAEIQAVFTLAKYMRGANGHAFHVDHIIPLQHELVCGLHVANNLRIVCATDNLSKHNKFVPGDVLTDDVPSVQFSDIWTSEFVDKVVELARRACAYHIKPISFYEHFNRLRVGCGLDPIEPEQLAISTQTL